MKHSNLSTANVAMEELKKDETRNLNGGSFHCDYCGWATWGAGAMKSHQKAKHNCGGLFGRKYAYHFHWIGAYNCYTDC